MGEREQLDGALRHERAAAVADPRAGRAPVTDARRDEVIARRLSDFREFCVFGGRDGAGEVRGFLVAVVDARVGGAVGGRR